jgi:hypothetical protein
MLFTPCVYASDITVSAKANNNLVEVGSEIIITLNLKSDEIIAECLFDVKSDDSIKYISMKELNNWSSMNGDNGILLSNSNISTNTLSNGLNILELKYKVNNSGRVVIKTMECVSVNENVYDYKDINVDFSIKQVTPPKEEDNSIGVEPNKNGKIVDVILSEGKIDFDSNVYEYNITVSNYDNLEADVKIEGNIVSYSIQKEETDNEKKIIISAENGNGKKTEYIINVLEEENTLEEEPEKPVKEKFNFVPIFIGIICLLVVVNIVRIVLNKKKKD